MPIAKTDDLCKKILSIDKGIRFAGVTDKSGQMVAYEYRKGLTPLLTRQESEQSAVQSIIRMSTRKTLENKLGNTIYAMAVYEKVKRISIPLKGEGQYLLMISLEKSIKNEDLVVEKVLLLLSK